MTKSSRGSRDEKKHLKLIHKVGAKVQGDRISELGDDILLSIISQLTLKEATATGLLSTRWKPLHTRTSRLNFPPLPSDFNFSVSVPVIEEKFKEFLTMIDRTLDSYEGGRMLKEFRVHMYCLKGANMKKWLEFALAREAEIIDIRTQHFTNAGRGHYCLQLENLSRHSLAGLKCLRELSLYEVKVYDGDIKILLSNSPNLEILSLDLEYNQILTSVSIIGHPKLQHFSISNCKLESIEIENVSNLVSLGFHKLPGTCAVRVNNVPKLIEFNGSDRFPNHHVVGELLFTLPSCILSQLLLVRLKTAYICSGENVSLPELINVKRLEVEWGHPELAPLCPIINLIEACRSLEELEMKSAWDCFNQAEFEPRFYSEYVVAKECSPNLKKVKLSGYLGSPTEWEVAAFIIKYAGAALQELAVEATDASERHRRMATANVRDQLIPIIPNSVKSVII